MKNRKFAALLALLVFFSVFSGCGKKKKEPEAPAVHIPTASEALENVWGSVKPDSADLDVDMTMRLKLNMAVMGFTASVDADLGMSGNIKTAGDITLADMDLNYAVSVLDGSMRLRTCSVRQPDGSVTVYTWNSITNTWNKTARADVGEKNSVFSLLDISRLQDPGVKLENGELVLSARLPLSALTEMLGVEDLQGTLEQAAGSLDIRDVPDLSKVMLDAAIRLDRQTGTLAVIELSLDMGTAPANVRKFFDEIRCTIAVNQLGGVDLAVPEEITG